MKRSTWTVVSWPVQPCASAEVPTSRVSTFGLPCDAERHVLLRIHGIVPGAGRKLDDAAADAVGDANAGEAGAARR